MFADQINYQNSIDLNIYLLRKELKFPYIIYGANQAYAKLLKFKEGDSFELYSNELQKKTKGILIKITEEKDLIILPKEYSDLWIRAKKINLKKYNEWIYEGHFGELKESYLEIIYLENNNEKGISKEGNIVYIDKEEKRNEICKLRDRENKGIIKIKSNYEFKEGKYELDLKYYLSNRMTIKKINKVIELEETSNKISFRI